MRTKKPLIFLFGSTGFVILSEIFAQTCTNPSPTGCGSVGKCTTIELNQPEGTTCTSIDYSAGQNIKFKPGFHYKATPGKRLHGWIEKPITEATYTPFFQDEDFDDREINTDLPVGSLPGNASVSSTGAATYTIPIYIPPGTAGMQPSISLSYNSQAGNGIAGYGWSISGLSSISRTPKSIYHDGSPEQIQFNGNDSYSLDGNRLVPCRTSCVSFCSPFVYYTEVETFSRITPQGNTGTGPEWFEVETKEGLTIEYGHTEDSRMKAPVPNATAVLVWNINKIYDRYGNYTLYHYRQYTNSGISQTLIDRIEYTGNTVSSPFNVIRFYYEIIPENDHDFAFISGSYFSQMFLLKEIQVLTEEELTKQYLFAFSNNNEYSFLSEVKEKVNNNTELNTTQFKYPIASLGGPGQYISHSSPNIVNQNAEYQTGDFNGDGKTDVVAFTYSITGGARTYINWVLYLTGSNAPPITGTLPSNFFPFDPQYPAAHLDDSTNVSEGIVTLELNGDGKEDLLLGILSGSQYSYIPYISTGANFTPGNPIGIGLDFNHRIVIGDYNGDKISDVFFFNNTMHSWQVYFFDKTGSSDSYIDNTLHGADFFLDNLQGTFFMPIDFNGDGRTEILSFKAIFTDAIVLTLTDAQGQNPSAGYSQLNLIYTGNFPFGNVMVNGDLNDDGIIDMKFYPGDFNGDGITDILSPTGTSGWQIGYGTGNRTTNEGFYIKDKSSITGLSLANPYPLQLISIADYNGDGKADIMESPKSFTGISDSPFKINYSYGKKFISKSLTETTSQFGKAVYHFGDFDGEGSIEPLIQEEFGNSQFLGINVNPFGNKKYLISDILNGFNYKISFEYKHPASGGDFYSKGPSVSVYPVNNFPVPIFAVSKISVPDGIGGISDVTYSYEGAKIHKEGQGFLGFSRISAKNLTSGISTVSEYEIRPSFYYPALKNSKTFSSDNIPLTETEFTNLENDSRFHCVFPGVFDFYTSMHFMPFIKHITYKDFLRDIAVNKDFTYDGNGNLTQGITQNGIVETITVNNTSWIKKGSWLPNKLETQQIITNRTEDGTNYVRDNSFVYNNEGELTQNTVSNSNDLTKKQITDYFYNTVDGNLQSTKISTLQPGLDPRTTYFEYDKKGRFVTKVTNPLGQSSETEYDVKWGKPLKEKSISGLETIYKYDAFGMLTKMTTPDGIETNYSTHWAIGTPVSGIGNTTLSGILFYSNVQRTSSPFVTAWFDIYGREIKTQTEGFNGPVNVVKLYNAKGQMELASAPFTGTEIPEIKFYLYENSGKETGLLKNVISSEDGPVSYTHTNPSGGKFKIETTNSAGQKSSQTTDASGKVVSATDDNGTELKYSYYSHGKLKDVSIGNDPPVASMFYDFYARQSRLIDMNAGEIFYNYNAFGELETQKDHLNNVYKMDYDLLGRLKTKSCSTCTAAIPVVYDYYSSGGGVNQIKSITDPNPNGINQNFTYDALGRLTEFKEFIDNENYLTGYQYNSLGKLSKITYPSGYSADYEYYNGNGYLKKVKNASLSNPIFEPLTMNSFGQLTKYNLGTTLTEKTYNSFGMLTRTTAGSIFDLENEWDIPTGNLISRTNHKNSDISETFGYDNLKRLISSYLTLNGVAAPDGINISYYPNGNIQSKTRIGNYSYDGNILNAVEQVGNPAGDISLNPQEITYTPFNKTATISENSNELNITYGPDQQRKISELKTNGVLQKKIIYSGNYEKIIIPAQNSSAVDEIYELHYLAGGAINVRKNGVASTDQLFYVFSDHLGSFNTITNASGIKIFEQNFDAWGQKRDPLHWDYNFDDYTSPTLPSGTHDPKKWLIRGFTGHEHLNEFALINMNGRVYDPLLGRMNSPDNYVQSPLNTQSYNRFSYAGNNPMKYTDPSGNKWEDVAKGIINILTVPGRVFSEGNQFIDDKKNGTSQAGGYFKPDYIAGNSAPYDIPPGMIDYEASANDPILQEMHRYFGESGPRNFEDASGKQWERGTAWLSFDNDPSRAEYFKGFYFKEVISNMTKLFDRQIAETYFNFKYWGLKKSFGDKMVLLATFMAKPGGMFDFKKNLESPFNKFNMGSIGLYRGTQMHPDDFGNYNFGIAARALGIPLSIAKFGAGIAPNSVRTWWNIFGGFDEYQDTQMIINGYNHRFYVPR